ncbi:hydantoinase/oxoprolinase family protein, partial [Desulfobacterales bacterium HSG17]|nr:hydantoinase/oxoprolinase family protein [Desulfobacterales bacterium HSG17]
DDKGWDVFKHLSTPLNPAEAVIKGISNITDEKIFKVIHGSTVATNAILEKKGAITALITNRRFEDIIEIGRQNRTRLYDLSYKKNPPLVPQNLRFGITGRIDKTGTLITELDKAELEQAVNLVKEQNVESVAVSFLFSFQNPVHEKTVGDLLDKAGIPFSLSHEILSEFREFERTSTTIINAYVSPKMEKYISGITENIGEDQLRIMQSNGGSISAATAKNESVRTILSGPAGGAVGAYEIGKIAGYEKLITFDMGGTSTDVSLIDSILPLTLESSIDDYPVKVPMIDIHTVGAGGGSIAFIDAGGALKVGPESAGANPGPICYGKGKQITVTDANLFLGRLIPDNFLGRSMNLDTSSLEHYFEKMSKEIGLDPIELAEGILSVANTSMERAIRVISVERGFDPRTFTLFSFGGAGGMHAAFLAKLLNIPKIFVPKNPGILSAIGMLMADIIKDYSQTVMMDVKNRKEIEKLFISMEKQGREELEIEGVNPFDIFLEKYLDMRYKGQSYEIVVPLVDDYLDKFHEMHEKTYGYCNEDKTAEIVNIRLRARGISEKPEFPVTDYAGETPVDHAFLSERKSVYEGKELDTKVISRELLRNGNIVNGPAILVEYTSTIIIPPGAAAKVDDF